MTNKSYAQKFEGQIPQIYVHMILRSHELEQPIYRVHFVLACESRRLTWCFNNAYSS